MCGSIKLTYVHSLQEPDITCKHFWIQAPGRDTLTGLGSTYDLDVWSGAELFVIIVCGSIPPLKILWDRYVRKIRSPTEDSSYYPKRTSGSNFTNLSKNGTLYSIQASHVEFVDQEAQKIPPGRIVATTMIDLHDIPASHLSM